jgi:threonine/homoserine/homoserine lactone efflux protein
LVLLLFLLTAAISFAGSLQAGPVNTYLLHLATRQQGRALETKKRITKVQLALAGSLAEVLYAALSVELAHTFAVQAAGFWFDLVTSVVIIGVGLGLLLHKSKSGSESTSRFASISPWLRTLVLVFANPQLIIFWSANAGYLMSVGLFADGYEDLIAFSLGAGAGAFVLLSLVLRLGTRLDAYMSPARLHFINQSLGIILLVLGLGRIAYMWILPLV